MPQAAPNHGDTAMLSRLLTTAILIAVLAPIARSQDPKPSIQRKANMN
jgi:hypothetical protein